MVESTVVRAVDSGAQKPPPAHARLVGQHPPPKEASQVLYPATHTVKPAAFVDTPGMTVSTLTGGARVVKTVCVDGV